VAGLVLGVASASADEGAPDTLRVMTFNILYEGAWAGGGQAARWPLVVDLLRDADADVIGLQEVLPGRVEPLRRALPAHRIVVSEGAGDHLGPAPLVIAVLLLTGGALVGLIAALRRRSPRLQVAGAALSLALLAGFLVTRFMFLGSLGVPNEHLALAWRPDRLRLVETRTLWLSETPNLAGSYVAFDTGPHIAFVASFERIPGGKRVTVMNTHVGHSPLVRAQAARGLRAGLGECLPRESQVLLGDFNATPDNPLVRALTASDRESAPGLRDAWLEAPQRDGPSATYHWSRPARNFLPLRLDYVLIRGAIRAERARVIGRARGDVVASDHDALIADLVLD
jgi:endonuclease/exonuclease/phosphatase family metal-dependent hydrolase